jgi:predicted NAD/FAD-binding protein
VKIAIIGSGIAGLTCAHLLMPDHEVTVYEAERRPGGHTNTVTVDTPAGPAGIDTGFLVFNERTYPGFVRLLDRLGIGSHPSDMSFSVSDERTGIEWRGTSPSTLFAQRRNALRPSFLRMLGDVARFNRMGRRLLESPTAGTGEEGSLRDLLEAHRWSAAFVSGYLVPLASSIWSADPALVGEMPLGTTLRFFERHGLLGFGDHPSWRTVTGGARRYVDAVLAPLAGTRRLRLGDEVWSVRRRSDAGGGVVVESAYGAPQGERYDHVVVAAHSDQALKMLERPSLTESELLGAIAYQPNDATLHRDTRVMPRSRRAWASWNYHRLESAPRRATLTYHLNRLQGLDVGTDFFVSLNRDDVIDEELVVDRFSYSHPVINEASLKAQGRHEEVIDRDGLSFCGAYWGNGFHEDGVQSALRVCRRLGASW